VSYRFEWFHGLAFLGAVLVLLIVPPFALIALAVVALAAVLALAALPYLLVRSLRRRRAARRRSTDENPVPMASVVARTGSAAPQSGVAAPTNTTTARGSA
jgi:Flp pilus assembly protein TadB